MCYQSDRETYAEDVDDYADDHRFEREGGLGDVGEWDDDAIHEEINGDTVECAPEDGLAQKKWKGAREEKENCSGAESDDVVAEEADGGGGDAASVGIATEEAGSDVVKDASGADVEYVAVDDEGGGDVERAAGQAGEENGGEGVGGGGGLRHVFSVEVEIILDVGMRSSVRGGVNGIVDVRARRREAVPCLSGDWVMNRDFGVDCSIVAPNAGGD